MLAQYAAAMMVVQAWELNLAVLVGVLHVKRGRSRPIKADDLGEALRNSLHRISNLINHTSASRLKNDLEAKIDGDVITEDLVKQVTDLVKWRDFLAHRYLRTRALGVSGVPAVTPLVLELFKISQAFTRCNDRITEAIARSIATLPRGEDPPPGVIEVMNELASLVMRHQPEPFGTEPPA